MARLRVAADIGGTFTDVALIFADGRLATSKVPSTPEDYAQGVISGILKLLDTQRLGPSDVGEVLHACTVATNTILEGKGARTALVTTEGFRDVLELRRIRVPRLYEPLYIKPPVLVPRRLRYEVRERLDARGQVVVPLDIASVDRVIESLRSAEVEAVAVCLLHSYASPAHERAVGERIRSALPRVFLSLSVDVLPEIREFERTSTTVINALVGPPVRGYLHSLIDGLASRGLPKRLFMMQSAGGILDARTVMEKPAQIVECGPAAGVIGARHVAAQAGFGDIISFDMGGTTAKASLIEGGRLVRTDEYEVGGGISLSSRLVKGGGYALKLPVIDISEVGAGGGSIVWIDRAGALKVGPHSAGASPGPACYGKGGKEPTVTDANVVLGYLNPASLAGGTVAIHGELSREAVERVVAKPLAMAVRDAALGIHQLITTVMTRAVKTVSTYRGRDPRSFSLFAFGGNGGIHAMSLARELGITRVILPPGAGVFSALGLLFTDVATDCSGAFLRRVEQVDSDALERAYVSLERRAQAELDRDSADQELVRSVDLRYVGQAFELTVPFTARPATHAGVLNAAEGFEREHERTYGHRLTGKPVEFVTLRVTARLDAEGPRRIVPLATEGRSANRDRECYFGPALGAVATPIIDRFDLDATPREGPVIVEEYEGTTVIPPGCRAWRDAAANILCDVPARD